MGKGLIEMKNKLEVLLSILILSLSLCGCTEQSITKEFGGSMELELPANQKLEEITWKDDDIWYLTRPMREDEEAEIHTFQASTSWGVFEGTVKKKKKKEEK